MGQQINFLNSAPKVFRDVEERLAGKEKNRQIALQFGEAYFDGPRSQGYGGYYYDGRWKDVATRLIEHYGLRPGARVLDVGCAKGFLVKDLREALPGLEVYGLDVSDYALRQSPPEVSRYLLRGDCRDLPFAPASFDLVLAINTVHNLPLDDCRQSLSEIQRVSRGNAFVQVDAYRSEAERELFEQWMLTAQTWLRPEGWQDLFAAARYDGDYYWTILRKDGTVV
jgi:SAM-dependent methyltransferase